MHAQMHLHMRPDVQIYLIANKSDLHQEQEVTSVEGAHFARIMGWEFMSISAKSHSDVTRLFHRMTSEMLPKLLEEEKDSSVISSAISMIKSWYTSLRQVFFVYPWAI